MVVREESEMGKVRELWLTRDDYLGLDFASQIRIESSALCPS